MRARLLLLLLLPSVTASQTVHVSGASQVFSPATHRNRPIDWYVDSVNGNDGWSGKTPATALRSIAGLYAKAVRVGDTVALAYCSYFREMLYVQGAGPPTAGLPNAVRIRAYGARCANPVDDLGRPIVNHLGQPDDRPRFDGADVIPSNSWTKTEGATNVYQTTIDTSIVAYGWAGMGQRIWESWVGPGYGQTGRLTYVADVATCDATPGTWTGPIRPSHGNDVIYIHATGADKNPATNGKTYEWPARPWGVNAGQYPTLAVKFDSMQSISVVRHGHHDGGLLTGTYLRDFFVDAGGAGPRDPDHGLWCDGTCEDGVASEVITYANNLPPVYVRRVQSLCSNARDGLGPPNGFYSHNNGQPGFQNTRITYEDVRGPDPGGWTCSQLIGGGGALRLVILRPRADQNTARSLLTTADVTRVDVVDPLFIRYGYGCGSLFGISVGQNTAAYVWGGRFVFDAGTPYALVHVKDTNASLTVTGTTFAVVGNEPACRYALSSNVTGGTINVTHTLIAGVPMPINASVATQGTIDFNVYSTTSNSWKHNGAESTTWAAWQGRGYDTHSARETVTFAGDPTTGNTATVGGSASSIGAGADAYGDAHLAEWLAAIP